MELKSEIEVINTRAKLSDLEARYEALRNDTCENENVRDVTLRSLKRYINQFKEEIARFECRSVDQNITNGRGSDPRGIRTEAGLAATRQKLSRLEAQLESKQDSIGDDDPRRAERIALKRLIKQLKEEIARYESRQPAQ